MPGSLLSDDHLDPLLVASNPSSEYLRQEELRRLANKVVLEDDIKSAMQRARHGKHRLEKEFVEGEIVYVWRKAPLGPGWWQGPGIVVLVRGNTVWLTIRGGLWKCSKNQLRRATNEESLGVEVINKYLPDLHREIAGDGRGQRKFVDITGEEEPPEEEFVDDVDVAEDAPGSPEEAPQVETPSTAIPDNTPPSGMTSVIPSRRVWSAATRERCDRCHP